MRQLLNGFNALYVSELRRSLVASGILALLIAAFAYASLARFWIHPWPAADVVEKYRAFWANRVRRSLLAVLATGASAFAGWALTGFVVGIAALTLKPELAAKLPHTPLLFAAFFGMIHGFSAGTALGGIGLFRFGFIRLAVLAVPLCGIYRQYRRQGIATTFNLPS